MELQQPYCKSEWKGGFPHEYAMWSLWLSDKRRLRILPELWCDAGLVACCAVATKITKSYHIVHHGICFNRCAGARSLETGLPVDTAKRDWLASTGQ